jgi:hypothetical protein
MTDAEKTAVKALAHYIVDHALPAIIDAEASKLPEAYAPLVKAILKEIEPALLAKVDAYIDEKLA